MKKIFIASLLLGFSGLSYGASITIQSGGGGSGTITINAATQGGGGGGLVSLSTGIITPAVMTSSLTITSPSGLLVTYGVTGGSFTTTGSSAGSYSGTEASTTTSPVPTAGVDILTSDSLTHSWLASTNGGGYYPIVISTTTPTTGHLAAFSGKGTIIDGGTGGGGGANPGGSVGQLQYQVNGTTFGGMPSFVTSSSITIGSPVLISTTSADNPVLAVSSSSVIGNYALAVSSYGQVFLNSPGTFQGPTFNGALASTTTTAVIYMNQPIGSGSALTIQEQPGTNLSSPAILNVYESAYDSSQKTLLNVGGQFCNNQFQVVCGAATSFTYGIQAGSIYVGASDVFGSLAIGTTFSNQGMLLDDGTGILKIRTSASDFGSVVSDIDLQPYGTTAVDVSSTSVTMSQPLILEGFTLSSLHSTAPAYVNEYVTCTNCTNTALVVSTGTATNQWASATAKTSAPN